MGMAKCRLTGEQEGPQQNNVKALMVWIAQSLVTPENLQAHPICEKTNLPREYM